MREIDDDCNGSKDVAKERTEERLAIDQDPVRAKNDRNFAAIIFRKCLNMFRFETRTIYGADQSTPIRFN